MNNGRPPYGDPSQWGQQPATGQDPAAQFVPGQSPQTGNQNGYQQPYAQPGYGQSQPYQTYQPQAHQAQEGYPQQTWQPYQQPYAQQAMPQAFQQQGGYQQQGYAQQGGYPQQPYAQQGAYQQPYQQGGYPQQQYAQQGAYQQPWQQGGYPQQNMPQQGYPQQQADPQMYQQGAGNGQPAQNGQQQFHPAQGYSGYVTGSEGAEKGGMPITPEVIAKVVIFGLLPVLLVLGLALSNPPLCWIFIAVYALTAAALWMWDLVSERTRLFTTLLGGVAAIVALVVAINGAPVKEAGQGGNAGGTHAAGSSAQQTGALTWEPTPTPSPTPSPTPDPHAESGAAAERLQSFFYFWHVNNDENMLLLTAPSWRNAQADPLKALFAIRANRTPQDNAEIVSISGSEADTVRTAKVKVTITKNISGRSPEILSFNVIMVKEDGEWYVDPRSLTSNEVISTTKATNEMPTQPVLHTGTAETVLYYNPDGGQMYHIDPYCGKINSRYLPLQGQFLFSQLDEAFYRELENCTYCGAPLRNK